MIYKIKEIRYYKGEQRYCLFSELNFYLELLFRIIRAAIDGAKNPIDKLGQFFKNYAIINLITIVFSLIASLYQRLLPEMYIVYALINLAVYLIAFSIDKELSIENITIHYQDLYYSFVIIIGYMILAKSIRKKMIIIERGYSAE